MAEVQMTVEEQDARLMAVAEQLDLQTAAKRKRVQQSEELVEQQREFMCELEETLVRLRERNQILCQK